MINQVPTRDEVVGLVEGVISGKLSQIEIAQWAEQFDYPENEHISEEIEKNDPLLRGFIDDLSLAGVIDEKGDFLYSAEDFVDWLNEFRERSL